MSSNVQQSIKTNSSNARNNILAKLKKQVEGSDYDKLPIENSYQYPALTHVEQVNQLVTLLEANHAEVIKLNQHEIPNIVSQLLKQRGISSLLMGSNNACSEFDLDSKMDASITVNKFDFDIHASQEIKNKLFDNTPASITNSHCSIAATGSIVLWPTVDEPRSLSLVPPLHFVIVDAKKIHQDFASLINAQQWQGKLPTNIVLVSGPSKTADIQQTLAYGAHGPKELIVLLLNS